ncbi:exodeoxyribonuclease VII large subunit [Flexilinea flocculi]|uniref:Exodeoxyribonuclease 7 large subunit n=1 Tax=Flexilinea flocculi TaxID=1678840 RepID=A0A0K8PAT5_9CHLR|nr:exodeoxyribonuclease VII large subunit [Flexilinea flocculi]GAP39756.1 exodeoxyribonuclease VII large subunit [Flexilinea flocculi]
MLNQSFLSLGTPALSVSDINRQIKNLLERDPILEDIWVRGEISNLSIPVSGHAYFTLKDAKSSLKCVIWRSNLTAAANSALKNGNDVEAHGKISVYEREGIYQLYADEIRTAGLGKLFEEFLRLKDKLEKEGLFDAERKIKIPEIPQTIGIVTSLTGAALQDMLNTIQKRWPIAPILLSPAAVQGVEAPAALFNAFERLEKEHPDVIIIGRGGGSIEDLWAFNDEFLVRRIAESPVPVISGIGHETDFTLVDFVADLRAPTPTGAAVAATPDIQEIRGYLDALSMQLTNCMRDKIQTNRSDLQLLAHRLELRAPFRQIQQEKQSVDQLQIRLMQCLNHILQQERLRLSAIDQRLAAVNPESVLKRGYALIEKKGKGLVTSAAELMPQDSVRILMADGNVEATIQ